MNFGNSIKKFTANINVGLKFFKAAGVYKPNCAGAVYDATEYKNVTTSKKQLNLLPFCLNQKQNEFYFPKTDLVIKNNIIEPDQNIKIKVELPFSSNKNKSLELPFYVEKEVNEPSAQKVIIKQAIHLIVIRRRKMKKHKKKKHLKKFKIFYQTRKLRQEIAEENALQNDIKTLIQNSVDFSPENYVNEMLKKFNWVKPVTVVRGRLAPDWVIKKHLKDEEEKKIFKERINECLNQRK